VAHRSALAKDRTRAALAAELRAKARPCRARTPLSGLLASGIILIAALFFTGLLRNLLMGEGGISAHAARSANLELRAFRVALSRWQSNCVLIPRFSF